MNLGFMFLKKKKSHTIIERNVINKKKKERK